MNGYYILAIVFIAVAAGLVVVYHLISFALWCKENAEKKKESPDTEVKKLYYGKKAVYLSRVGYFKRNFRKFVVAIVIMAIIGALLFVLGIGFDKRAEQELVKYTTRYDTMVGLLNNGDFYKYGGNEIARMCAECAEWKKTVDYKNDRYGRFSSYYAIKDNVECAFIAEVNE